MSITKKQSCRTCAFAGQPPKGVLPGAHPKTHVRCNAERLEKGFNKWRNLNDWCNQYKEKVVMNEKTQSVRGGNGND